MKKEIHPSNYRAVVIEDTSNGFRFLTKSTAATDEKTKWDDGNEYPLVKVHISSASHPFYTGEEKIMDIEGRVDRFKARAEAAAKKREAMAAKAAKNAKRAEARAEKEEEAPEAKKPEKPAETKEVSDEKPKEDTDSKDEKESKE
jgi:large subunit ribosomal protein L31